MPPGLSDGGGSFSGYFLGGLLPRPLPDGFPVLLGALGGEPRLLPFAKTASFPIARTQSKIRHRSCFAETRII